MVFSTTPFGVPSSPVMPEAPTVFKFKETADYEKGFELYFEDNIKPVLKELDRSRIENSEKLKKTKPWANLTLVLGIAAGIGLSVVLRNIAPLIILGLLAFGVRHAMVTGPGIELAGKFKSKIVPLVIKFFGEFQYSESQNLDEQMLINSCLFDSFNRSSGEDFISGSYHETNFSFFEANLGYHTGKSTRNVFTGMILLIDLKNSCQGKTIVKRENEKGLWSRLTGSDKGLKNFKLNEAEFEGIFEAYTSSELEARSFLTPELMNKLVRLNAMYVNNSLRCAFFENKMLLAITYGDTYSDGKMFESFTAKKMTLDVEEIHKFLAQFHEILAIIDQITPKPRSF